MTAAGACQRLMELINGFQTSQAIYVAVTLGIPDLLRNWTLACDELASATGSHPGALYRLLRALAAIGVLSESEDRRFALAPLGRALAGDAEPSRMAWVKFVAGPPLWPAWGHLLHSVRTGETGFRRAHGQDVLSFRRDHPEESTLFDLRCARTRKPSLTRSCQPTTSRSSCRGDFREADPQLAGTRIGKELDLFHTLSQLIEHRETALEQGATVGRRLDALWRPIK